MGEAEILNGAEFIEQPTMGDSERKKLKRQLRYLSKFNIAYFGALIFCMFVGICIACYNKHSDLSWTGETFAYYTLGGLFVALAVGAGIFTVAYAIYPTKLYDSQKLNLIYLGSPKKTRKRILGFFYYLCTFFCSICLTIVFSSPLNKAGQANNSNSWLSYILNFFIIIICFIVMVILRRKNKKLAKALIAKNEEIDKLSDEDVGYGKFKTFSVRDLKNFRSYDKKTAICVLSVCVSYFLIIILIFCLTAFIPPNPYKRSSIEKIDIGDNSGYVYRMLGEPYDRSDYTIRGENGEDIMNGTWTWCSSGLAKNIAAKNRQLEKLSEKENMSEKDFEKTFDLMGEIATLELELATTRCDYVTVNFVGGVVTQIEFNNNYLATDFKEVSAVRITYSVAISGYNGYPTATDYSEMPSSYINSKVTGVNARMYLSDGSMVIKSIRLASPVTMDNPTALWSDQYGEHTLTVKFE